jgi:hypothetical protein
MDEALSYYEKLKQLRPTKADYSKYGGALGMNLKSINLIRLMR